MASRRSILQKYRSYTFMANYNEKLNIQYFILAFILQCKKCIFYKRLNNIFLYMYISIGSEDKNIEKSLRSGNWAVSDQTSKLII